MKATLEVTQTELEDLITSVTEHATEVSKRLADDDTALEHLDALDQLLDKLQDKHVEMLMRNREEVLTYRGPSLGDLLRQHMENEQ